MTAMEGRGILRGGLVLLGLSLVRLGLERVGSDTTFLPEDTSALESLLEESQRDQDDRDRRSEPLGPGEQLDPNRIDEAEFDRLPGIGPATARAIVVDRQESGGFSRAEDLLRVPGIGPAKLGKISAYLDFSQGVPLGLRQPGGVRNRAAVGGPEPGTVRHSDRPLAGAGLVDLNRATLQELEALPGIGPALARRVMESRAREGSFNSPEDLLRVKGIGPAKLARLQPLVRWGG
jgi:competence ComEA-like helix-hairpin-helix protein